MTWKKHFKPVNSVVPIYGGSASDGYASSSVSKYNNWLPEIYMGPPDRLQRYTQYELMDMDHEISAAMDTIAEFSTQPILDKDIPFSVRYKESPTPHEVTIIEKYLQQWCSINDMSRRAFRLFRSTLMYGDQFLVRDPETFKLFWVDPNFVEKVVVNESQGKKIEAYYIKNLDLNIQNLVSTNQLSRTDGGFVNATSVFPNAALNQARQKNTVSTSAYTMGTGGVSESPSVPIDASSVIQLSLTEGLDANWPFGLSVLEKIFKVFKQKELLEDAILIYRIHRAPERRVFKIDTGTLPPHKAHQYLERVKNEVQQKRIPNRNGGGNNVTDSAYNPLSTLEDYFFAVGQDGRGSSVDTLEGGANIGEIDDLKYFNNKMLRALGVPSSYLPTGPEDGTASKGDGKVGSAFIQEFRFSEKCKRFQRQVIKPLDVEFKLYLKHRGITIDSGLFEIQFNEPQNFAKYRQIELDSASINLFTAVSEVPYISKRFALGRYLGWTQEEIMENEKMFLEEKLGPESPNAGAAEGQSGMRQAGVASSDFAGDDVDFGGDDMGDEGMGDEADMGGEDDAGGDAEVTDADVDGFGT